MTIPVQAISVTHTEKGAAQGTQGARKNGAEGSLTNERDAAGEERQQRGRRRCVFIRALISPAQRRAAAGRGALSRRSPSSPWGPETPDK